MIAGNAMRIVFPVIHLAIITVKNVLFVRENPQGYIAHPKVAMGIPLSKMLKNKNGSKNQNLYLNGNNTTPGPLRMQGNPQILGL